MSAATAMRCLRLGGPAAAFARRDGPAMGNNSCRRLRPLSTWNWSKKVAPTPTSVDTAGAGAGQAPGGGDGVPSSSAQQAILSKCSDLHSSIMPMNSSLSGPLAKNSDRGTSLPFVFLVGNHSSGKSSFINYVLGRPVQTAGVAPTDDCFTVIAPGPADVDQDGPALVGDPDIGFEGKRTHAALGEPARHPGACPQTTAMKHNQAFR